MTDNPNPTTNGNGGTNGGAYVYADAKSVAGLARDIEALARRSTPCRSTSCASCRSTSCGNCPAE